MNAPPSSDGLPVPRRVFVAWFGPPMPVRRIENLESIQGHVGVDTVVISEQTLDRWLVPGVPLHPSFDRLSAVHQADYLRCYLMHHHGGGYADLKPVTADWRPEFDRLDAGHDIWALGYREVGRHGVGSMGSERIRVFRPLHAAWWRYRWLQLNHRRLIGVCAFLFRPRTALTAAWWAELNRRLDGFAAPLASHPARHPRDHEGFEVDGRPSGYPIPWSALLADILHPLALRHRRRILRTLPPPRFTDYR